VIKEGHVQAGDEIVRTRIGPHALSVADVDALLYLPNRDVAKLRSVIDVPALSPGWQRSFRELLDADGNASTTASPVGVEPGWSGFRRLLVADVVAESADVVSVHLASEDGGPLPEPKAGQYLPLRVAGAGDPAPIRSYSLSSAPRAGRYRISVKREPKGLVSAYLHTQVRTGAILEVAAPRGDFVLTENRKPVLLISAGIGITPVLAMLHHLAAHQSRREVWWIHTAKDPGHHPFADEAHRLLQALSNAHEHTFYTAVETERRASRPLSHRRVNRAALTALGVPGAAIAYVCGPATFMTDMHNALRDLGVDPNEIHSELFGARPPINPGISDLSPTPPHLPAGPPGTGPLVTFSRSGLAVRWSDAYPSLLELAEACDVPTRFACRAGVCHTCTTPIVSGDIIYDPSPLERPDTGEALICCARAGTDLVLDL
jgi:ferredoxin-NADP reductase/ferredoxin